MRNTFLLLACLFLAFQPIVYSQNDSLKNLQTAIENANSAKEKANVLNLLSDFLRRGGDLKKAQETASLAMQVATDGGFQEAAANANDNFGLICEAKFDYANAMKNYVEALKIREKTGETGGIGTSKHRIGRIFLLQGDLENAQVNLEKALDIRQKLGDPILLSQTNRALGDLFREKKIFGKAQEFYRKAMDEKIEANDLTGAAQIAGLLGNLTSDLGDHEGALVYFRQSFDLNSSTENLHDMGHDLLNMGGALVHQQNYGEALSAFQSAEQMFTTVGDTLGIAQSLENQANAMLKTGNRAAAETTLSKAQGLLSQIKPIPGVPEIFASMASVFHETGNISKAYECLMAFTKAEKQVFGIEKNKALLELTTRYESEFAAEEQKRTIEKLELQQKNASTVRWALLAILGFAALAVWALLRSNRQKRRDNTLLKSKNDEIDAKNRQLNVQNFRLDDLNKRLVGEIANREMLEQNAFNRDQFLTVLSREMRAPMNDILAYTRTLLADAKNGKAEMLRNIQYSANNLLVLVNDMLDYSQIETGKIVLENVEFEPKKVVAEVEKRFMPVFREKSVRFAVDFDPKIPLKLAGDPGRFNQILTNVLNNVAQHASDGDVRLHLIPGSESGEDFDLKIELNALGALLEPAEIDALSQTSVAAVENMLGENSNATFGLVLTKRLVHLQNGMFKAENFGEEGSVFSMVLPFKKSVKKPKTPEQMPEKSTLLEGKYILVAEDNKINQLVVTKMLQKCGAVVVATDDGVQALHAFQNGYFDLVLMDIQMPRLDGYRTVAEMRKSDDSRKKATPIIALTASAYLTDKDKAELFQMNDHIGKPFSPEELLEKVVATVNG